MSLPHHVLVAIAKSVGEYRGGKVKSKRRLYSAVNPLLYNGAFAGYVAGVSQARGFTSALQSDLQAEAQVFAESVDRLIAYDAAMNTSKAGLLEDIVEAVVSLRSSAPSAPETSVAISVALYEDSVSSLQAVPGTPAAPVPGVPLSASGVFSPQVDTTYLVDTSGGPVVFTYEGVPPEGLTLRFIDVTQMWVTHAFTFASQAEGAVRNPGNLGAADAPSVTLNGVNGGSVGWFWTAQEGWDKWLSV